MSSETSMAAADFRLQEWAAQIKDCRNRPAGMSVVSWCACHGISKANYYYRLRRVWEACLETVRGEMACTADGSCTALALTAAGTERHRSAVGTGYFHKGMFHPCNRVYIHAAFVRGS